MYPSIYCSIHPETLFKGNSIYQETVRKEDGEYKQHEWGPRRTFFQIMKMLTVDEVSKHNSDKDCWVIINGNCYDLTEFAKTHPGGSKIIYREAGKDASAKYNQVHPPNFVDDFLDKKHHLGPVEGLDEIVVKAKVVKKVPPLSSILDLYDMETVARSVLDQGAWAYYSSGAGNEISQRENEEAFNRIYFKPRILINVENVDTKTKLLGCKSDLPFYITATALGKLGHPDGEVCLTRAAGTKNVIQMIPTLASCSMDEIIDAKIQNQIQWFQVYVNKDRNLTANLIRKAESRGVKAICITVDAPQLGRREKDMRVKFEDDAPEVQSDMNISRNQGAARAISSFIDPSLSWKDLPFLRKVVKTKLVLKGIQCGEDAILAAKAGVDGIIISNHGGRQLDTCRSAIEILQEVMTALQKSKLDKKIEVLIDGGIRRGSDIFKAIALGASGVGIGRPFLYSMSAYGQQGVEYAIVTIINKDLLREDLEMTMRLCGVTRIDQISPKHVLAENLTTRYPIRDYLRENTYVPMRPILLPKL